MLIRSYYVSKDNESQESDDGESKRMEVLLERREAPDSGRAFHPTLMSENKLTRMSTVEGWHREQSFW